MMMPEDALAKERQILVDVWEFRKKYYVPEDTEKYWQDLILSADNLVKKYPDDLYVQDMARSVVDDIARRGKKDCCACKCTARKSWPAVLDEGAEMPTRGSQDAAGIDLRAMEDLVVMPGEIVKVRTGFHVQPSKNTMGLLFMRSGLAKQGLRLTTGVSVIDPDYTGEIVAFVQNDGDEIFKISKGDRVCQLVFVKFVVPVFDYVDKLAETERGAGGFGSTGVK